MACMSRITSGRKAPVRATEPVGGAHRDTAAIFRRTGDAIANAYREFSGMSPEAIRRQRHEKFLGIGRSL